MSKGVKLAQIMDDAARRVLAGVENPYDIAMEAGHQLAFLEENESPASSAAYVYWMEISDINDDPRGPESTELCSLVATDFSRGWLELPTREDEAVQFRYMASFREVMAQRIAEYNSSR